MIAFRRRHGPVEEARRAVSRARLPDVRVPDVKAPELRVPEIRLPDVKLPDVNLNLHLPEVRVPDVRLPDVRLPDVELTSRAPFVRRRRNPIVQILKFAIGLAVGLIVGCIVAALLAPAAGDDTRRRLMEAVPKKRGDETPSDESAARRADLMAGGIGGLLQNPGTRLQMAREAFRAEKAAREAELKDQFHRARRVGHVPDPARI